MVAIIDHFSPMETFDLDNLVKVAEEYDKLCRVIKDRGEHEIAETCELVGGVVISSRDPHRSSADNLFAKLGTVSLNVHSKITIALISYLRHGQLFKIEKRFGFVEESYFTLDNDDRKQRGHDVLAKLPPSFRQIWNNQFIPDLGEAASKPDEESELRKTSNQGKKSKQGRESKPGKKPESNAVSEIEGLVKLQFNCKLAVKGLQDLSKTISNAKKPVDLPSLPTGFRYANVPVREDVPDEIRERILDQEFAMKEIPVLQGKVSTLLYQIHHVFAAWYGAGDAAWEFGKKHIHEMPLFREYEYTRLSLQAISYTACRRDVKIVEFYSSRGAPRLPWMMRKAYGFKSRSPEKFEMKWEMLCLQFQDAYPSVDKMIAVIDEMLQNRKIGWIKWLVENPK
ncbi:hypothetical protein IMSHALPRED_001949 [Imshaugia aleurites]|uniref:Uncharacterized protein n=1 Tax=Imshaugia aleurites TaxID=172621 RepID=A0A8H3F2L4_9LECA|nr:hypothetical protein IMSHALPRED_001949 [Imshaugia aleurites]